VTETSYLRTKLHQVRSADKLHDQRMNAIAIRGGIVLDELRAMPAREKDAFITKWARDGDYEQ